VKRTKADSTKSATDIIDVPAFMADHEGRGLERFGPEDVYPLELDPDLLEEQLNKYGFDPFSPLEMLLEAIIAAHPMGGKDTQSRLTDALLALLGSSKQGRRSVDDYDLLLDVAWKYHQSRLHNNNAELSAIIRECYAHHNPLMPLSKGSDAEKSMIKRIMNKLHVNKALLLARVTSEMDCARMDNIIKLRRVAEFLQQLGVELDQDMIRPRLRGNNFR
jgi:hypothetical protein